MEVEYDVPQVVVPLPLNRRISVSGTFHGSAMYCENLMMRHFGTYSTEVDAKGKIYCRYIPHDYANLMRFVQHYD